MKLFLLLVGKYLAASSTPGAITLRNTEPRSRSHRRPDTLKKAKSVEGLKVGESERRRDRRAREALTSRKGKTDYGAHNKQGIQPRHGKLKGKPNNGRKQGEPYEYDRYGYGTRKLPSGDTARNKKIMDQLTTICNILVPTRLPEDMEGTVIRGNVVLKG